MTKQNLKQNAEKTFASAKNFSDFLGFHVRFGFCWFLIFFLLIPRVVELLETLENGTAYSATKYSFDIIASLLIFVYGIAIFCHIINVGIKRISLFMNQEANSKARKFFTLFIKIIFSASELCLMAALILVSSTKGLELLGWPWSRIAELHPIFCKRTNFCF